MKRSIYLLIYILLVAVPGFVAAQPQTGSYALGTVAQLRNDMLQRNGNTIMLGLPDGSKVTGVIVYENEPQQEIHLQGTIAGKAKSGFNIDLKDNELNGRVFLHEAGKAYVYSTVNNNVVVTEADIRKLICVDFLDATDEMGQPAAQKPTTDPEVTNLQSNPGAGGCLLLDFDGYEMPAGNFWNSGNAISAATSGMTNEDILIAWKIVSEDYFPFNLNVTTSEAVFNTYPQNKRSRCVVTPTNYFFPGCVGIAFTGSFLFMNEAPCWIFTSYSGLTGKRVGEAASHELGHTMGLSHDGGTGSDYYFGHGNWAPIMGNSLNKPVTQWSKGEYNGATNTEDDLAIIAGSANGVGYRADDHANTLVGATTIVQSGGTLTSGQNTGFIGSTGDLDVFKFTTIGGTTALNVKALSDYTDIRLEISLLNSAGSVIDTYIADANNLTAQLTINQNLAAGTYYLMINGSAAGTASADYNNYSSLGRYEIFGALVSAPLAAVMSPLHAEVVTEQNTLLTWKTYSEKNNSGFTIERSTDGRNFREMGFVSKASADGNSSQETSYQFTDTKSLAGTAYYRIVQVDQNGTTSFSDIVSVNRSAGGNNELNIYPNPAVSQITIALPGKMAADARVVITDIAGRIVKNQAIDSARVTLDISGLQAGIYLVRYADEDMTIVRKVQKY